MNPDLQSIYSSLNSVYDPQRQAIQQQIGNTQQAQQGQLAGLDQARTNAFQGITDNANSRGLMYSGVPVSEQAKYVGSTYLPAVANLQAQTNQNVYGLQSAANALGTQQTQQASGMYDANRNYNQQQGYYNQQLAQQKQYNDANLAQTNAFNQRYTGGGGNNTQSNQPNIQTDLQGFFSNYGNQPKYYTENTVIPAIAGAYYNGDKNAAAKAVYGYRKQAIGS